MSERHDLLTYRHNSPIDTVEHLQRRIRALERAHAMSSPLRALHRAWHSKSDWTAQLTTKAFWLLCVFIIVGSVVGAISSAIWRPYHQDQVKERCSNACARSGLMYSEGFDSACVCVRNDYPVQVVTPSPR
jgi:hypothetical protein